MKQNQEHIDNNSLPKNHEEFLQKADVPLFKSKEEIWEQLSARIEEKDSIAKKDSHKPLGKQVFLTWRRASAIAAIFVLIVSGFVLMNTTKVQSIEGQHVSHLLPDGSVVELNACSEISYRKYLWNFERSLELEGEAYFKVQKGEKFSVKSTNGTTQVLGTSFNIYARDQAYEVYCTTGKVKVSNEISSEIITPGEKVSLNSEHKFNRFEGVVTDDVLFWREHKLKFVGESIDQVFEELQRQYGIQIRFDELQHDEYMYTGNFPKKKEIDSVLDIIALSLNLKVKKEGMNQYTVVPN